VACWARRPGRPLVNIQAADVKSVTAGVSGKVLERGLRQEYTATAAEPVGQQSQFRRNRD
jgi:hypothetical protein